MPKNQNYRCGKSGRSERSARLPQFASRAFKGIFATTFLSSPEANMRTPQKTPRAHVPPSLSLGRDMPQPPGDAGPFAGGGREQAGTPPFGRWGKPGLGPPPPRRGSLKMGQDLP